MRTTDSRTLTVLDATEDGAWTAAGQVLPPLYGPWVEEILGGQVPAERHATCLDCAMCKPDGEPALVSANPSTADAATASVAGFNPKTKCCTYVPGLPNFLVGLILRDESDGAAAGRESVQRRISEGVGVTPLGLQAPPNYALIYKYGGSALFGLSNGLRCPHYLEVAGGLCGIWRHRNSVCTTWFCKHERGAVGKAFWDALVQLLGSVERHLAWWCATELGEGVETLGSALLPYYQLTLSEHLSGGGSGVGGDGQLQVGTWSKRRVGRICELYAESARLVAPLSWTQVVDICGPTLSLEAKRLLMAYAALKATEVPEYLRLAAVGILRPDTKTAIVSGYSNHDMPILPSRLLEALFRFDGQRPTYQVVQEIATEAGMSIDAGTLRRLVDHQVLIPMPSLAPDKVPSGRGGPYEH